MSLRIDVMGRNSLAPAKALLARACAFDEAAEVAEEKLFGPGAAQREAEPLAAFQGDELVGLAVSSERWLRLLAVHPDHRNRGVGTALLSSCEEQMRKHSQQARVMDQPGNYLSPGIDQNNSDSIHWLQGRGYQLGTQNCNLLVALRDNALVSRARLAALVKACGQEGYAVERQSPDRVSRDAATIAGAFSAGWAFEMQRAASYQPGGVHIALHRESGELAAFAAHDGNNQGLGWFGPTGTLPAHRKQGLGAALLMACLMDLADAGYSQAQIAWIGPRDFYEKIAGIAGERHFSVMTKDLSL